ESSRVFVFNSPEQLRVYLPTVRKHACKNNVFAIQRDLLAPLVPDVYNFSIIGSTEFLLARYVSTKQYSVDVKKISFSADIDEIKKHDVIINHIIRHSVRMEDP